MPVRPAAVHAFSTLRYAVGLGRSGRRFFSPRGLPWVAVALGRDRMTLSAVPTSPARYELLMLTFLHLISSRSNPAGVVGRKDYLKGTKITATR